MRHFTSTRRATAILLLVSQVVATSGCTGWITQNEGVAATVAAHPELRYSDTVTSVAFNGNTNTTIQGSKMRVTTTTAASLELQNVHIRNDSLFGRTRESPSEVGIPLAAIRNVQVRGFSAGKTAWLVGGAVATVGTLYLVGLLITEAALCSGFGC